MHICWCVFTSYPAIGVGEKRKPVNSIVCLQKLVHESSNVLFHYWQSFFLCLLFGFLLQGELEFQPGLKILHALFMHQLDILYFIYLLWPCDCIYLKRLVCRTGYLSKKPFIKLSLDPFLRNLFDLSHIFSSNLYDLDRYHIMRGLFGYCWFCFWFCFFKKKNTHTPQISWALEALSLRKA